MFNGLSRDSFNVNLLIPAIQTAATFVTVEVLGRLGQYSVSNQTAILVSGVASIVASFASNFFNKAYLYYTAAIPVGIGAGLATHTFFYPTATFDQVLDVKGIWIIAAVLGTVKLITDNFEFFRRQEKKLEEELLEIEKDVLISAEEVAKGVEKGAEKVKIRVEAKKEEFVKEKV